jgi:hypothetical protein
MVEIGDDALTGIADDGRDEGDATGRHVDRLAGIFAPIFQHVPPQHRNLHALVASTLLGDRKRFDSHRSKGLETGEVAVNGNEQSL